jgi:MFS family permease
MTDTGIYRPGIFHGHKIVALTVYAQLFAVGCSSYIFGLFIEPVSQDLGVSRSLLGWGPTIIFLMSTGLSPLFGYWLDKGGFRSMAIAGSLLLAAGLCALSVLTQIWQLGLALALLVGLGAGLLGPVPSSAVIVNWYEQHRGMALGISAAGISLGGFILPPVTALLIAQFGWQGCLQLLGIVALLTITPAAWKLAIAKPADIGLRPLGEDLGSSVENKGACGENSETTVTQILGRGGFWIIALAIGLGNGTGIFLITYIAPFSAELGVDSQRGAFLISALAASSLSGKFVFGYLCDRFSAHRMLLLITLGLMCGWGVLLSGQPSLVALIVGIVVTGVSTGGLLPVWNLLVAQFFGQAAFARAIGLMYLVTTVFILLPGPIGGYGYDLYGGYAPVMRVLWFAFPVMAVLSLLLGQRHFKTDKASTTSAGATGQT